MSPEESSMSSSPISSDSRSNIFFAAFAQQERAPFGGEDDGAVSATAPEGSYTYAIIPSAPQVDSAEVESGASALEITVKWGQSVLHVAHLSPVRDFTVGETACDFTMSAEKLGTDRVTLVSVDVNGAVKLHVAANATARILKRGQAATVITTASSAALESDARATVELGGLTFEIASVKAGKKVAGSLSINKRAFGFGALAAAMHGGLFAAMFAFTPALDTNDDNAMSSDQQAMLTQTLSAMAEKQQDEQKDADEAQKSDGSSGDEGKRAKDSEGKVGSDTAPVRDAKWQLKNNGPEKSLASMNRQEALQVAESFGMISIVNQMNDPNALRAPWGDMASGNDKNTFNGNMWADQGGNAFGNNGLGLSSDGLGGGSYGNLIGLGNIGDLGHTHGNCTEGPCNGDGFSGGRIPGTHKVKTPGLHPDPNTPVSGRLPAEVIQRVIRQNFGRFRGCYEFGLRSNPNLQGRVVVSFVIGVDGSVGSASNGGSDLPDPNVVSCIVRSFGSLSFPAPDGGVVSVGYPIVLAPTN